MKTGKTNMLAAITLIISVMALVGSAQAFVTVAGLVNMNSPEAVGEVVTLWLDEDPLDNTTKAVQDGSALPDQLDYYWFDAIDAMLDRHGYVENDPGSTNIPITIAMFCSGEKININQGHEGPYTNQYMNVTMMHATVDYVDCILEIQQKMELESCASEEPPFIKTLYAGWNLISLPLAPSDNSVSAVLSTVSYDAVYRYNATSKQFESADVMDPGTGYFVNATEDCEWGYSGAAYTSMDVSLKKGLNMVGWLNCSKDVGDALSSISGKYHYVARWNTSAQKFEVYNPSAPDPSVFNDFTTMNRGTGYFISAKQECAII